MKPMMSLVVKSLVTILIGGGTLAMNLQAQTDPGMTVSIPFPFTVGTQNIAPGTYRFSESSDPFLLSVCNVQTGHEELFLLFPEQRGTFEPRGRLVFRTSEGSSILNKVQFPGSDQFSEVIQRHRGGRIEAARSSTGNSMSVAQR